jgi:hypothetical protein
MADDADRLACREDRPDETQRIGVHAQPVGIRDPAWKDQPVVFVGVGLADDSVDLEGVAAVEVVERLDLAVRSREQSWRAVGVLRGP